MSKKKVTAPLSYSPGGGHPKEYLAYLNWREMETLKRLHGSGPVKGPRGIPSFIETSGQTFAGDMSDSYTSTSTGNWNTSTANYGTDTSSWSSDGGGSSYTGGSDVGSVQSSSDVGGIQSSVSSPAATAPTAPAGGQNPVDAAVQQEAAYKDAVVASRQQALSQDIANGGISAINVGPMNVPVKIGGGQIAGTISDIAQQTYTPPSAALGAVTRGPGSMGSQRNINISSALSFSESLPGINAPDLSSSLQRAALENQGFFSVKGATPEQQALVDRIGPAVLRAATDTGLDPRTILGQALTESTTSRNPTRVSRLARDANNLFGVKAVGAPNEFWGGDVINLPTKEVINGREVTVKEPFRKYESPEQAIGDYARLINKRYSEAASFSSPEDQLRAIRGGGYATHPSESYVGLGLANISKINIGGEPLSTVTPAASENEIAAVEDVYRNGIYPSGSIVGPGQFGYPTKPGGTPVTAEDLAAMPEDVQREYMDKMRFARMTDKKYPLTTDQKIKVAAVTGITAPVTRNIFARTATTTIAGISGLLGKLPGQFGDAFSEVQRGMKTLAKPGQAVAAYERLDPLKQQQLATGYGVPSGTPGGTSGNAGVAGIPTQELGGKNPWWDYRIAQTASYSPTSYGSTTGEKTSKGEWLSKRELYSRWDRGIGIPSPGDPNYNEYQEYLAAGESDRYA